MLVANIISGVLSTLPAFGTLAGESLWLLTPHNLSPKLAGRSQINNVYGALCCLRNMQYIDGLMGVFIMAPLIVCVWTFSSPVAALFANLCLGAAGPFLSLVAIFMIVIPPMGGVDASAGVAFAVFNLLIGANMVWRTLDPGFLVPAQYAPVIASWHAVCMLIFAIYTKHFLSYAPKLKNTMMLEKMKDDAVTKGSTWIRGEESPVDFGKDLNEAAAKALKETVAAAQKEQTEVMFTPLWRFLLEVVVLLGGLAAAVLTAPESLPETFRNCVYVSLALTLIGSGFVVYVFQNAAKGAYGKQEVMALL